MSQNASQLLLDRVQKLGRRLDYKSFEAWHELIHESPVFEQLALGSESGPDSTELIDEARNIFITFQAFAFAFTANHVSTTELLIAYHSIWRPVLKAFLTTSSTFDLFDLLHVKASQHSDAVIRRIDVLLRSELPIERGTASRAREDARPSSYGRTSPGKSTFAVCRVWDSRNANR